MAEERGWLGAVRAKVYDWAFFGDLESFSRGALAWCVGVHTDMRIPHRKSDSSFGCCNSILL